MALAWVAMIENAMTYQGIERPASRYVLQSSAPLACRKPKVTMATIEPIRTIQSIELKDDRPLGRSAR